MMRQGFTLIEISIVLVIIGLIVGGVLAGRDLISAASVRAQIAQIERYNTAANTFKGKYGYLPGDIPAAQASNFGFSGRGGACNLSSCQGQGDGNGVIEGVNGGIGGAGGGQEGGGETVLFWSDLSRAGLVEGGFTAASMNDPVSNLWPPNTNLYFPVAKVGQGNSIYVYSGMVGTNIANGINYFGVSAIDYNQVAFGLVTHTGLTVAQAYQIDKKIDDGLPQSGTVTASFIDGTYYWAAGGGNTPSPGGVPVYDAASTEGIICCGKGDPTTAATAYRSVNCYDNGGVAGPEQYSLAQNAEAYNCAVSFRFK